MWFYVDKQRQQRGPVSVDELKALLARDEITKRTHLWQEGRPDWVRLEALAPELGISIATPPPTPAATIAIPAMPAPVQPAYVPPQSPMAAPPMAAPPMAAPPMAAPPMAAPPMAAPPMAAPPMAAPPMAAPQAPAFPSFPQAPAPSFPQAPNYGAPNFGAPTTAASGGAMKFLGTFVGCMVLLWLAYSKLGHLIPGLGRDAKGELLYVIDEFEPARAEIRRLFTEKSKCPGTELPISAQKVRFDYYYGSFGDANECAIETTYPADFKIKAIAGTRVFFLLRNGEWLCGMSATDAVRPGICEKIDATRN